MKNTPLMKSGMNPPTPPSFLGIECGGTRTLALWSDSRAAREWQGGPANLRLVDDAELRQHFLSIARAFPRPAAVAVGMAGMRSAQDRARILGAAGRAWPQVPCVATNDLEIALAAAPPPRPPAARVLVLSGTGSCCYGKGVSGETVKVGGWGHFLGDRGSGYDIGLRALREIIEVFDHQRTWPKLGERVLRTLLLNEPNDLISWVQTASKAEVASLAIEVFAAWKQRDAIAGRIITAAAERLAVDALACAARLAGGKQRVHFLLAGSVLLQQPRFAALVGARIRQIRPSGVIAPLAQPSVWGAVALARAHWETGTREKNRPPSLDLTALPPPERASVVVLPNSDRLSPTEQRNPRSAHLDRLPILAAVELMLAEEDRTRRALWRERKHIARGVALVVQTFRGGGRLFYVGAGSSGRLGVLDASECPPTFRASPDQVQGIMAGGQRALWQSVEDAEDDPIGGANAVFYRGVRAGDLVVGIAASGRTPFVWGALRAAHKLGAKTVLICFNPHLQISRIDRPTCVICPDLGPEVLTGSTRLKAGTATKLILNILTTLAMVRLGKVLSNLMVDLNPSNTKLRDRAVRILGELTGADAPTAQSALEKSGWVVKSAWAKLRRHFKESSGAGGGWSPRGSAPARSKRSRPAK